MSAAALTTPGTALVIAAGATALGNWWSVSVGNRVVEWVTKPLVMVLLIAAALVLDPVDDSVRIWVVAGLVLSLAGDVFLMLPRERFIAGLASFLVAHVAYVGAFAVVSTSWTGAGLGLAAAVVASMLIGRPIVASVRRQDPGFTVPVIAYMAVISVMVVAACATTRPWLIVGAFSFFASDGILATNKFVRPLTAGRFAIMSTYHAAQFCFVIALTR